jgi:hypothetical protein
MKNLLYKDLVLGVPPFFLFFASTHRCPYVDTELVIFGRPYVFLFHHCPQHVWIL